MDSIGSIPSENNQIKGEKASSAVPKQLQEAFFGIDYKSLQIFPEEVDSAFEKVEDFLRACRMTSKLNRSHFAAHFVQEAIKKKKAQNLNQPLESIAIDEARDYVLKWAYSLFPEKKELKHSEAMLAIYLNDIHSKFQDKFLALDAAPELKQTFQKKNIRTAPDLEFTSMVPEKIDMGVIHEIADSTMDMLNKWPLVKMILGWLLFIGLMIFLFWYTRGRGL